MLIGAHRPPPAGSFRPDIEGLRGVAILAVVGCHCGIAWCAGGFVGVDIFFVLSGYLITGLLASEYAATSRIDFPGFYARRARRLLPACILMLAVTALFALLFLSPQEMIITGRAARAAGVYLSNVYFDRSAADYFASNVQANPLLHTWSLGLEEQFYLVWPFLLFGVYRGAGFWPLWPRCRSHAASTRRGIFRASLSTSCPHGLGNSRPGACWLWYRARKHPGIRAGQPPSESSGWAQFSAPVCSSRAAGIFRDGSHCSRSAPRLRCSTQGPWRREME
jgi:hypothetical protein